MSTNKPSKPWRIILTTDSGPIQTDYRSQKATYEQVIKERDNIASGYSRVNTISVYSWESGRWGLYEDGLESV